MILPGHDSAFLLRIDSHPSKSVKSVVKFSSFLPSHLPFVYFATTYRASDRLLLGTIIVAALGTQFRG
jgi:hypothetical protein